MNFYGSTCRSKGFNLKTGGSRGKHSEETKEKLRKMFTGFKHTDEAKAKISAASKARKGLPLSQKQKDAIARMSVGNVGNKYCVGRKMSDETKRKLREVNLGNKHAKGNKTWLGRKHSPESIEKMRLLKTGLKHTEETKEKMRLKKMGNKCALGNKSGRGKKYSQERIAKILETKRLKKIAAMDSQTVQ